MKVEGVLAASGGAVTGPYLGVWLSLFAINTIPIGIAQTLLSLSPIMILPFARKLYGDRITPRTIAGTAVAFGGVALLFRYG